MKHTCIWKKQFDKDYVAIENPKELANLCTWLEDASTWKTIWVQFLQNNANEDGRGGNISYIVKKGNKAYIGDSYAGEFPDPNEFEASIDELVRLLEEFIQLKKLEPNFILLHQKNGVLSLEARNLI